MPYQHTHTRENFRQGLKIGDKIKWVQTGDRFISTDDFVGWERIIMVGKVTGFNFPWIITDTGTIHYDRLQGKCVEQLTLF